MRIVRPILCVAAAAALLPAGCSSWMDKLKTGSSANAPAGAGKLEQAEPRQFVYYVNERAARVQSLQFGDVRIQAYDGRLPLPKLSGGMACVQPRNFRMTAEGGLAGKIDIGSNPDQFWVYAKAAGEPMFVYCSYADFESGRGKLPGALPFEPDWVMQVLGMVALPADTGQYTVTVNAKERTYTLSWPATTPQGQAIRKEVVFNGDAATGDRPQVRRHAVKDMSGRVLCTADIKSARTMTTANGPVQYPTKVALRWEEQKFEMDLTLNDAQVNDPSTSAATQRFQMPRNTGSNPLNLADYRGR